MYSIRETFVFQTEIYTFRIFIPSLCCFFFLSSRWGSVCCCYFYYYYYYFLTRSKRTCRCHSKWSFFGSSVFLVVKNPYDLRLGSPQKKPTLRLLTGGLSWGTQSVFAIGFLSSPLSCLRQIAKRGDPGDKVGHFMWAYTETLRRCRSDFHFKLVSSKISFLLAR